MESSAIAIPEMLRTATPLLENGKISRASLAVARGQQHSGLIYSFHKNAQAFLALTDAVPKPYPFPEEARRQLQDLRIATYQLEAHLQALLDQRETALRGADRDNLKRYAEANTQLPAASAAKPRVVFLGDSITDGWRLNEYFPDQDFVNRGISGQITGEMLGRMKADVIDLKPVAMVFLGGTNDFARGVSITTIQNNIAMIGELAAAHRIKPIFASILPVSDYGKDKNPAWEQTKVRPPDQIRSLNNWLKSYCQNRGFLYLDYYTALVDGAGFLKAETADDGLHPNALGYRLMAPLAAEAIQKTVGGANPVEKRKRGK
ncbi:MAG: SGNH/GDSL hydrolase family protein [Bryobacteraceae bacterium]|nr:SGNH/GDSL hydrolase family protein [Bryobacteraceae bacterium]